MQNNKLRRLLSEAQEAARSFDRALVDSLLGDLLALTSKSGTERISQTDQFASLLNKVKRLRFLEDQKSAGVSEKLRELEKEIASLITSNTLYATLHETGLIVERETDVYSMLAQTLDKIIAATQAEKGFIVVSDPAAKKRATAEGGLRFQKARNDRAEDIPTPVFEVSKHIIEQVLQGGQPICTSAASLDKHLSILESVRNLGLMSVLCVPIKEGEAVIGAVYLDNRSKADVFSEETCRFVSAYGSQVATAVKNLLVLQELESARKRLENEVRKKYRFESLLGNSPKMLEVLELVAKVAGTDATILLEGESGTGKELVARAIHFNSERSGEPLVAINCGAIPENLLESELFGHVKGAFTDAASDKKGKFELAEGETLFLDEISEMSPALQVKLLRVLQFKEFSPVGSNQVKKSDVRIIAATNIDLKQFAAAKKFREDLYYRLNVFLIRLAPLRERKEDLPTLINHFLESFAQGDSVPILSAQAEALLLRYDYPGNVRELENALQRAVILCRAGVILPEDLPDEIRGPTAPVTKRPSFREAKEQFEKEYIQRMLVEHHGVIRRAAKAAGLDVKNFYEKMKQYGLKREG